MRNFENKEKIIQLSGGLRVVAFALMLFWGGGIIQFTIGWISGAPEPGDNGPILEPNSWHFNLVLVSVVEFIVWWNFWKFFSRLKAGHLFDALTVKRLSSAGWWKIAIWFYSMILMWVENKLQHQLQTHVVSDLLDGLFVGVGIVFTAWLLREGQTLEEEQKLTV
jgi:hypothetical protein